MATCLPTVYRAGAMIQAVNGVFGFLFLVSAGLQYNDPDPIRWIVFYLAATVACGVWSRGKLWPVAIVALTAVAWALWIATQMPVWVSPALMFEPMQSRGGAVELSRELYGLGIVAFWMGCLLYLRPARRKG